MGRRSCDRRSLIEFIPLLNLKVFLVFVPFFGDLGIELIVEGVTVRKGQDQAFGGLLVILDLYLTCGDGLFFLRSLTPISQLISHLIGLHNGGIEHEVGVRS